MDGPALRTLLLRLLAVTAGTFVLALPFASVTGSESKGFTFAPENAALVAGIVLAAAIVFLAATRLGGLVTARLAGGGLGPRIAALPPSAKSGALVALVLLTAVLPWLGISETTTKLLLETMVFATIAVGLQITIGMAGLLVLGHAAFWAVGAYTYGMLVIHAGWSFWPAFLAGGVVAAAVGFVVGLPALRLRGDYLAVVTLGFGEAIRWVLKNEQEWTGGDANLPSNIVPGDLRARNGWLGETLWQPGSGENTDRECYLFALALLVVCVTTVSLLSRSRIGRALFALREDETAARAMGIDTTRMKLLAFTASALWAGLAGAVPAVHRGSITPELFTFDMSVLFVAIVVLGGLGSIPGALLGAALLWIVPTLLQSHLPQLQLYRMLLFGGLMAAMMVVRPDGLLGAGRRRASA